MATTTDAAQRTLLEGWLRANRPTDWQRRAYTDEAVADCLRRLRRVEPGDFAAILNIAGFTLTPFNDDTPEGVSIEQSCATCMYYERHREFCNLPEIALPVRTEWSCVLWRI